MMTTFICKLNVLELATPKVEGLLWRVLRTSIGTRDGETCAYHVVSLSTDRSPLLQTNSQTT